MPHTGASWDYLDYVLRNYLVESYIHRHYESDEDAKLLSLRPFLFELCAAYASTVISPVDFSIFGFLKLKLNNGQ